MNHRTAYHIKIKLTSTRYQFVTERTGVNRRRDIIEMEVTVLLIFSIYLNSAVFSAVKMT
jgi:hypothetical protein